MKLCIAAVLIFSALSFSQINLDTVCLSTEGDSMVNTMLTVQDTSASQTNYMLSMFDSMYVAGTCDSISLIAVVDTVIYTVHMKIPIPIFSMKKMDSCRTKNTLNPAILAILTAGQGDSLTAMFPETTDVCSLMVIKVENSHVPAFGQALAAGATPNPFNAGGRIIYTAPWPDATLSLYDIQGRVVSSFGPVVPGKNRSVVWNGKDIFGKQAAAGQYIAVLRSGSMFKSAVLLKTK